MDSNNDSTRLTRSITTPAPAPDRSNRPVLRVQVVQGGVGMGQIDQSIATRRLWNRIIRIQAQWAIALAVETQQAKKSRHIAFNIRNTGRKAHSEGLHPPQRRTTTPTVTGLGLGRRAEAVVDRFGWRGATGGL